MNPFDTLLSFVYRLFNLADDDLDVKNIFKDEWENSDAIFIVEQRKFHVHRQHLSLVSPVLKAMFSSEFREKDQQEIPLPGKKAKVFLSFLLIVYLREDDDELKSEYKRNKNRYNYNFNLQYNNCFNLLIFVRQKGCISQSSLGTASSHMGIKCNCLVLFLTTNKRIIDS